ncbi:hypothetical protein [Cysteiniphilum marinum]|uniref:hypothetical protein n=1 Tax=Cysteiniphilum marinum TaxID=2774191 RepID=UPI001783E598|nr:hypothetical protein [Cysteiniphilum marinum]
MIRIKHEENAAKHFSCGDCMEMSALGAQFLKQNGFDGTVSVMGIGEDVTTNHAFIEVG